MAANACKLLCLLLVFAFITQGYGQCDIQKNISLKQSKTGKMVKNKPEWEVRLTNPCPCTVLHIKLSCAGFKSVTPIDGSVVSKTGDVCLLKNGDPIYGHEDFVFNYVWHKSFPFKIIYGDIACS